ncbi:MAG: methenyltetrahydromethanopterin cyclohydrolase, partial [Methylococcales bacterium]|nr:methenyltetrahydromethanopterin cyclohydrolase [Methylococcales bacterium]
MSYWLVIATSGRMLAQAAQREGFDVLVIDCYADVDTLRYAKKTVRVNALSVEHLKIALTEFTNYEIAGVVYGSGFETHVESLYFLQSHFLIAGNSPAIFEHMQNKRVFFTALDVLKITYPETYFAPPFLEEDRNLWLRKPLNGQGGVGIIKHISDTPVQQGDFYFQRFYEGQAGSVSFLANGKRATIIGFNTQWTHGDFLFAGISNYSNLTNYQKTRIYLWLQNLVLHFNLHGLNSLDFVHTENSILVLEINPRPSASMQLYDFPFFSAQIDVNPPPSPYLKKQNRLKFACYQIIYAPQTFIIPHHFAWSENEQDLPHSGAIIPKNQPICSMIARGVQLDAVLKKLKINAQKLEGSLTMKQASVNKLTQPLVQELINNAAKLRVGIEILENGCTVIDAGINHLGGLEAGRIIAEICLGGMGTVSISHSPYTTNWPLSVNVHTGNPVLGCLGSQYAGWSLSHEKYYALGSGPARAMATKQKDGQTVPVEDLYQELAYHDE